LAQDVFLKLHGELGGLKSPAHVKFWLRKAITNRCIDESRRLRMRPRVALGDIPEPAAQTEPGDLFLSATLRTLIATLPARARLVVILRYQEDLGPADIAAIAGIPVKTVKSHLYRSLAVLRAKLNRTAQKVGS
jgi:RNA polymerase sigma-70 factor (ECF subfamily)